MGINKVVINDEVKLDLTEDTVAPDNLLSGVTAHDKSGNEISGTLDLSEYMDKTTYDSDSAVAAAGGIAEYVSGHGVSAEDKEAWDKAVLLDGKTIAMPFSANWQSVCYGDGVFVAVAYGSNKAAYSTDNGLTWNAATLPSVANWQSVCYGNGVFVAVAESSNKAAYSTDNGATWTEVTMPFSANWFSVCYGDGVFVAEASSSNSNKAAYSTDNGATWTEVTMPFSGYWRSVCYGDGVFVAVAYGSNKAAYSTDNGLTWNAATLPFSGYWRSVCYGDGVFVAEASNSNKAAYSTDNGATWTEVTMPFSGYWRSVCYGDGVFVAVAESSNKAAYSTDNGLTWNAATLPFSGYWRSVCYGDGVFVAIANTRTIYSTDKGKTWSGNYGVLANKSGTDISGELKEVLAIPAASTTTPKMDAAAAVGTSSTYAKADHVHPTDTTRQAKITASGILKGDGTNISAAVAGVDYATPDSVETAVTGKQAKLSGTAGQIVGFDAAGAAVAQDDKAVMLNRTVGKLPEALMWTSVCADDNGIAVVAVAYNSDKAAVSVDVNEPWAEVTMPSVANWQSVCYGNGVFVAVAESSNKAAYSTDNGATWNAATLPSTHAWFSVCYGGNTFVAVANDTAAVAYSTDNGATWTEAAHLPTTEGMSSVCYDPGASSFYAVPSNGDEVIYGTGDSWMMSYLPASKQWMSVRCSNDVIMAIAFDGMVVTTEDSVTWTTAGTLPFTNPTSLAYSEVNNAFVVVAAGNKAAASLDNGATWTPITMPADVSWSSVCSDYITGLFVAIASGSTKTAIGGPFGLVEPVMATGLVNSSGENIEGDVAGLLQNHLYFATPMQYMPVTLIASQWNNKTLTVSAYNVTADDGGLLVIVTPAAASMAAYYEAGVYCSGQGNGEVTFTCNTVPTENLSVYVVTQNL